MSTDYDKELLNNCGGMEKMIKVVKFGGSSQIGRASCRERV